MKFCALLLILSCACSTVAPAPRGPYVVVLGTAQDGGLPQIGCAQPQCVRAREDASRRRFVTSLLLADPRSGRRWLFDASPDLPQQFELARPHPATRVESGPKPQLFDGVFLTHAHVGHFAGLIHFGREVYGASGLPVFTSPRMGEFLAANGPWSLSVRTGAIELAEAPIGREMQLGDGLFVSALRVPHRDEFSDTLAFVVRGPRRTLAYLPDIDKWERWEVPLEEFLASVDVALVDGTFYAEGELPGRSMAEIPHPFVVETLARLARAPAELRAKVVFTHLNHTNPLADPRSAAREAVLDAGLRVAEDGEVLEL